jgi:hypothetical protein
LTLAAIVYPLLSIAAFAAAILGLRRGFSRRGAAGFLVVVSTAAVLAVLMAKDDWLFKMVTR